ncbi:hypothetical protein GCM10029964_092960 [Kibdelosporangium lantanae]
MAGDQSHCALDLSLVISFVATGNADPVAGTTTMTHPEEIVPVPVNERVRRQIEVLLALIERPGSEGRKTPHGAR